MSATELVVDKSTWGDGPWQSEPDRVDFVHAGFACMALRHPEHGNWCGYVGVPHGHPVYGIHPLRDESPKLESIGVHQGLNYGSPCKGLICHAPQPGMPDDVWWLGFDCGHAFDVCPGRDARLREMRGAGRLRERAEWETYRDLPYVRREIESLAEQLAMMRPLCDPACSAE